MLMPVACVVLYCDHLQDTLTQQSSELSAQIAANTTQLQPFSKKENRCCQSGRRRCSGPRCRGCAISVEVMVATVVAHVQGAAPTVVVERVGVAGWSAAVASVHRFCSRGRAAVVLVAAVVAVVVGRRHGRTVVAVGLVESVCVVCARQLLSAAFDCGPRGRECGPQACSRRRCLCISAFFLQGSVSKV